MKTVPRQTTKPFPRKGFTLVEILIVVVIIGLLAAIGLPAIYRSKRKAAASRAAADFKTFSSAFEIYCSENGEWPVDGYPATIPPGLEEQLTGTAWTNETAIGGLWDFDGDVFGIVAGVSINGFTVDTATLVDIDVKIDDGNLSSGFLRLMRADQLTFVLEE